MKTATTAIWYGNTGIPPPVLVEAEVVAVPSVVEDDELDVVVEEPVISRAPSTDLREKVPEPAPR